MLNAITTDISNAVNSSKFRYHDSLAKRLNDPKAVAKIYWSIIKTFVNGSRSSLIKPLSVGNRYVADFLAKADLFNDFFSKQCCTIVNNSSLPTNLPFETESKLSTFDFSTDDIIDPKKSHGRDAISVCTIKVCAFQYQNFYIFFLKTDWKTNASSMNRRRQILFQLTRKEISNRLIIINRYCYC